ADPSALLVAEAADVLEQTLARGGPLVERILELHPAEVAVVVGVEVELRSLPGGDRRDARLEALPLAGREMARDVAQRPGPDPGGRVVGRDAHHGRHELA